MVLRTGSLILVQCDRLANSTGTICGRSPFLRSRDSIILTSDLPIRMTDLARKKRIRGGHRGSVTKTVTKVNTALAADPVDGAALALLRLTLTEKQADEYRRGCRSVY